VFESILFNKTFEKMIRKSVKTELHINEIKGLINNWRIKFDCLQTKINNLIKSTKCGINTRHISIQNQNQMVNFNTLFTF